MIREAQPSDLAAAARLASRLWPEHAPADLEPEFSELIESDETAVFLLFDDECRNEGDACGFAQCQLRRDYVEGTSSSPVGYLEGIYVDEARRRRGHARELLRACEAWAKERGCTEFASDCELDNAASLAFHLHAGFEEANRLICFAKRL
ncbi:MAG: aminoglycoside 6'-N-acetyltransferase [Gordonibacter urolithinfaciens]